MMMETRWLRMLFGYDIVLCGIGLVGTPGREQPTSVVLESQAGGTQICGLVC